MKLRPLELLHFSCPCWTWDESPFHEGHTWTERLPSHYGDSRCVIWKNQVWVLGMGSQDWYLMAQDLHEPHLLYVLSGNDSLGYIGLERLDPEHNYPHPTEPCYAVGDSIFFQNPDDLDPQPKPWLTYRWHTQIRRLAEYLPD